jgi:hypothetical protein
MGLAEDWLSEMQHVIDSGRLFAWAAWDPYYRRSERDLWVYRCPMCRKKHATPGGPTREPVMGEAIAQCDGISVVMLINRTWKLALTSRNTALVNGGNEGRKPISARVRRLIERKAEGRCWYCGSDLYLRGLFVGAIDHVKPVAHGGTNDNDNLVPACKPCNQLKRDKSLAEFRAAIGGDLFWFEKQQGGWQ